MVVYLPLKSRGNNPLASKSRKWIRGAPIFAPVSPERMSPAQGACKEPHRRPPGEGEVSTCDKYPISQNDSQHIGKSMKCMG